MENRIIPLLVCLLLIFSIVITIVILTTPIAITTKLHTIINKSKIEKSKQNPNNYKPVVIVHGLLNPESHTQFLQNTIKEIHPGTEVIFINLYVGIESFTPLWNQVAKFREAVESVCMSNPEGVHMIGISQGAVIGRGIIESSNIHNIKTFVSMVGPQFGQYGLTDIDKLSFYHSLLHDSYKFFYSGVDEWLSVAELWRDPERLNEYREKNIFLPILNNEIQHNRYDEFKKNFLKIENMVLIGGPDDGIITPWQSSQFAFVDATGNVTSMENQEIYINDTFGLRTLQERGGIVKCTIPKVDHKSFQRNAIVAKECVIPHLN